MASNYKGEDRAGFSSDGPESENRRATRPDLTIDGNYNITVTGLTTQLYESTRDLTVSGDNKEMMVMALMAQYLQNGEDSSLDKAEALLEELSDDNKEMMLMAIQGMR